jgi:hypothetical protein
MIETHLSATGVSPQTVQDRSAFAPTVDFSGRMQRRAIRREFAHPWPFTKHVQSRSLRLWPLPCTTKS